MITDYNNIMLGVETLGTRPYSTVLAIGAVRFNIYAISDFFRANISIKDSLKYGLTTDEWAISYWNKQNLKTRNSVMSHGRSLVDVLNDFARYIGPHPTSVWGDEPGFQNVLIECLYEKAGIKVPWYHTKNRCFSTLRSMYPDVKYDIQVDDDILMTKVLNQARHVIKIVNMNIDDNIPF